MVRPDLADKRIRVKNGTLPERYEYHNTSLSTRDYPTRSKSTRLSMQNSADDIDV
jgi:hypothetical protein